MTKDSKKQIIIKGAKEHNLQNIDMRKPVYIYQPTDEAWLLNRFPLSYD